MMYKKGMLVMNQATQMAIQKAKEHGMALVATHHTASGTGAIGYFGREIAQRYHEQKDVG